MLRRYRVSGYKNKGIGGTRGERRLGCTDACYRVSPNMCCIQPTCLWDAFAELDVHADMTNSQDDGRTLHLSRGCDAGSQCIGYTEGPRDRTFMATTSTPAVRALHAARKGSCTMSLTDASNAAEASLASLDVRRPAQRAHHPLLASAYSPFRSIVCLRARRCASQHHRRWHRGSTK